jgi:hypothetical protein
MVLTQAEHLDVPDEDELLVVGLEGGREHLGRVDPEAGEEFRVGLGDPGRGLAQPVTIGILTDGDEDLPYRFLDPLEIDRLFDG